MVRGFGGGMHGQDAIRNMTTGEGKEMTGRSARRARIGRGEIVQPAIVTNTSVPKFDKTTLADHVINAATNPHRQLGALAGSLGSSSLTRLREISSDVRAAQRMLVDPSAVRAAARVSVQSPTELLAQLRRAAPPGRLTWWEWDEHERMRELIACGYTDGVDETQAAHRCGFLVSNVGGIVRCQVVSQHLSAAAEFPLIIHMVGFVYQQTFDEAFALKNAVDVDCTAVTRAVHEEEHLFGYSLALGQRWCAHHPLDRAYRQMALRIGYWWAGMPSMLEVEKITGYRDAPGRRAYDLRGWPAHAKKAGISVNGDLRFLLSLLVLNSVPETLISEPWTSAGARAGRNSARLRLPGNVFRTLRVEVPRERLLERIRDYRPPETPTGRRHRDHAVEPHIARRRKGYENSVCEHTFDREEIPHFCTSCGYREWPRRGHRRGDPVLGIVMGPRRLIAQERN